MQKHPIFSIIKFIPHLIASSTGKGEQFILHRVRERKREIGYFIILYFQKKTKI
jgi:hypothetical protein